MAIQFARIEYVSRSTGGNACRRAAYNQRESIRCERTGESFYFKNRKDNAFHEILLPAGADSKFQDSKVLWNAVEFMERRQDSQVSKEAVLALPDDKQITLADRIEISKRVADKLFISKGLAVQLDIHSPHDGETNWHAHMLVTTRRFTEDGQSLSPHKARDTDPQIKKGFVVEADAIGEIYRDIQNEYFLEKGYDIRVDPIGIVPQKHLGPVRMRHHMSDALERSNLIKEANAQLGLDPDAVINELTRQRAVFNKGDVERSCAKHVAQEHREEAVAAVLSSPRLISLLDKGSDESLQETGNFTTAEVRAEENKLLRFAGSVAGRSTFALSAKITIEKAEFASQSMQAVGGSRGSGRGVNSGSKDGIGADSSDNVLIKISSKGKETSTLLSSEQQAVFNYVTADDSNLKIIIGRAGVGKSYVLNPIREAYEQSGYRVIGLAPTNKVAVDLANSGFKTTASCHLLLFKLKNDKVSLDNKTVLVVDEAAMLGTELAVELFNAAKRANCKLILIGDDRQLPAIERGGMFSVLASQYGSTSLETIRRQETVWQRQVAQDLSEFKVTQAVSTMQEQQCIRWCDTKEETLKAIVDTWARDSIAANGGTNNNNAKRFILAQRNVDVDALNFAIREVRKERGEIGARDLEVTTTRGREKFAVNDRIQFTTTDKPNGIINGNFGFIKFISNEKFIIEQDTGEILNVDPAQYHGLRHGYAGTVYKAQGSTISHVYVLHDKATCQPKIEMSPFVQSRNVPF